MEKILNLQDLKRNTKFLQNPLGNLFLTLEFKVITLKNLFFIFISSLSGAVAQSPKSGQVSGKIFDAANNEVLSFATIGFFQTKDTKDWLVGGMTVPISGEFLFTEVHLNVGQTSHERANVWC